MLLVLGAMLFSAQVSGQDKLYKTTSGSVQFFSETPMENIAAVSKSLAGAINPGNNKLAFTVFISSFEFENKLMQEHFNENYMESEKYPKASFSGKINEDINLKNDGTYTVTVAGKLNIHGVEKERTLKGTIAVKNGKLSLESNFDVKLADHNIDIPKLVVKNIAEVIAVTVKGDFELK